MGVAALSGPVDTETLGRGLDGLRTLGYEPVLATNSRSNDGLFAGSDHERLEGLHTLLASSEIGAVFFARGGHGLLRLLPRLDWDLVAARPRWFVGYSDVTPLLLEVVARCGWVTLHGPLVAVELAAGLERPEAQALDDALRGRSPAPLALAGASGDWASVGAPLTGGCLSMLVATLGTPYAFSAAESVLFLEDIDEPLYRIDRMLQQLKLSGALEGVAGVVLGELTPSDLTPAGETGDAPAVILEAVRAAVGDETPLAWGCPSGHCRPNYPLPLGGKTTVDPVRELLVIEMHGARKSA